MLNIFDSIKELTSELIIKHNHTIEPIYQYLDEALTCMPTHIQLTDGPRDSLTFTINILSYWVMHGITIECKLLPRSCDKARFTDTTGTTTLGITLGSYDR